MNRPAGDTSFKLFTKALFGWLPEDGPDVNQRRSSSWWYEFSRALFGNPVVHRTAKSEPRTGNEITRDDVERSKPIHAEDAVRRADESISGMLKVFRSFPAYDRMEFRSHAIFPDVDIASCDCVETRRLTRDQVADQASRILGSIVDPLGDFPDIRSAVEEIRVEALSSVDKPFGDSLSRFGSQASRLVALLESRRSGSLTTALELSRAMERNLRHFKLALHNFVGDDLSKLDLSSADLAGIIWSDATTWPEGLYETVKTHSEQLFDGVYRVRGDS